MLMGLIGVADWIIVVAKVSLPPLTSSSVKSNQHRHLQYSGSYILHPQTLGVGVPIQCMGAPELMYTSMMWLTTR